MECRPRKSRWNLSCTHLSDVQQMWISNQKRCDSWSTKIFSECMSSLCDSFKNTKDDEKASTVVMLLDMIELSAKKEDAWTVEEFKFVCKRGPRKQPTSRKRMPNAISLRAEKKVLGRDRFVLTATMRCQKAVRSFAVTRAIPKRNLKHEHHLEGACRCCSPFAVSSSQFIPMDQLRVICLVDSILRVACAVIRDTLHLMVHQGCDFFFLQKIFRSLRKCMSCSCLILARWSGGGVWWRWRWCVCVSFVWF